MKTLKLLFAFAFAVTLSLSTASCGDDDGGNKKTGTENGSSGDQGGGSSSGGAQGGGGSDSNMSESAKKEYIDQTARVLVDKVNADDFKPITDLGQYVREDLAKSSKQTKVIEDFFEAAVDMCILQETSTSIKRLFEMGNFSAEFSYQNGTWVKASAPKNTLRFNFNDKNGQPCVAEVVGSGREVEVHASVFDETHKRYDYSSGNYGYYTVTEENRFKVPEQVNVKLTCGNSILANIQVKISVSGGEFKYNASNASVTMDANIVGYRINLSKAYYNGGNNAGVDVTVSKNNEMLVKASASAKVRIDEDGEFISAGNGNVNVDVLGKVQVKGTIDDFNKIRDLDKKVTRESSESEVKDVTDQMNKQFNIGVYFDGSSTRQAYLQVYPFLEKKSYYERWDIEPVICFDDGTSYSTLKEFGDDSRFKELIKKVEKLVTDFENLVK